MISWDFYFISIADAVSEKSHCLSVKRGCVIVRDRQILSTGYNNPPKEYYHCDDKKYRSWLFNQYRGENISSYYESEEIIECPRRIMGLKSGEGLEYCPAAHAEINAISQAARSGIAIKDSALFCNFKEIPCRECAKAIINSGISEIVLSGGMLDYPQKGIKGRDLLEYCKIGMRYV